MNWVVFGLVAYGLLVLETGLRTLFALPDANGVAPSFMLVLLVFVGLMAPGRTVGWAGVVIGLLVDLQHSPVPGTVVIGPGVLAYLLGGYAMLQLRALIFRESVVSVAILVLAVGALVQIVIVAALFARGMITISPAAGFAGQPIPGWRPSDALVRRFLELVYTAILALPVGWCLLKTGPIWGFPHRNRTERLY